MWLLFHRNAKTRAVDGGRSFIDVCPECDRRARFEEVEVSENYGVFFIDIIGDKERKYRCSACHEVFDLRDEPGRAPAPSAASKSPRQIAAERAAAGAERAAAEAERAAAAAERRRDEAERRREEAEARANRIEDELADLKKRMGH
jgi:hypothetical protein